MSEVWSEEARERNAQMRNGQPGQVYEQHQLELYRN